VLTGHVLKDPGALLDYNRADASPAPSDAPRALGPNPPTTIDARLDEVERILREQ
jgi:hypothetical protein